MKKIELYQMNGKMVKMFISVCLGLPFIFQFSYAQKGTFIDQRDGKIYRTIQIGSKTWMAENLAYIPLLQKRYLYVDEGIKSGVYCYNDDTTLLKEYGALYSWDAANVSCPVGWHLPSKYDFDTLLIQYTAANPKSAWEALNIGGASGFEAKYGGLLYGGYLFLGLGKGGNYWTSTKKKAIRERYYSFGINLEEECKIVVSPKLSYKYSAIIAYSVRCIKD